MSNLLDNLKNYITPELVSAAATTLGESESGVGKAVSGLLPTILAGMLNKAGDPGAMGSIFHQLSNQQHVSFLDQLEGLVGGGNLAHNDPKDAAGALLGDLFGAKVPAVLNALSAFAGIKSSSTSSLLGLVGPLVMGYFSKKINADGLNLSGLVNLLQGEKNNILGALPGGLGTIMGLTTHPNTPAAGADTESSGGTRWLLPLLLLLALGGAIMLYLKNCTRHNAPAAPTTEVAAPAPAPTTTVAPGLSFPEGTQEAGLLAFVKNPAVAIDKTLWFDFPEIQFDVNKATLKPESEAKLSAVLAILQEFPAVKLKVGGYTDSDGNDAKNLTLSDARAKAAAAWLVEKGIAADRLDAEGYGESNPVAPNDTPENKAKNRRISFSVRAK